jgi:hypothetical protein
LDKRVPAVEEENRSEGVPEPKGMIVYDPDHPLYEHRHVCFVLRKVSDALHGYTEAESADTEEY